MPWWRYAASIIATVGLSPAGVENEPVIVLRNGDASGIRNLLDGCLPGPYGPDAGSWAHRKPVASSGPSVVPAAAPAPGQVWGRPSTTSLTTRCPSAHVRASTWAGGAVTGAAAGQAAAARNGASDASSDANTAPDGPGPPPMGTRSSAVPWTATTVSGAGVGQATVSAPATGPIPASAPGRAQAHA